METKAFSNLMKAIMDGKFVYTGELEPHKTADITDVVEWATTLKNTGKIVAANVTDNPQSMASISSLAASYVIQRDSGLEVVYQLRCSDRSRMALFSDLLGASMLGLRNVLSLTGDHPATGDAPQSKPVFDLDSAQLVELVHNMVYEKKDYAGNEIHGPDIQLNVGGVANPGLDPVEPEVIKVARKAHAGADFIQTQVIFEVEAALNFLDMLAEYTDVPVLMGIFPPRSYGQASFFDKFVTGVTVPKDLLDTFKKFKEIEDKAKRKEKVDEYNITYFVDFIKEIRKKKNSAGCHIMAVGYPDVIAPIITGAEGK